MYLDRIWVSNFRSAKSLYFDLRLYLDRTLAQWKAYRKAKSKVKVTQCKNIQCQNTKYKISTHKQINKQQILIKQLHDDIQPELKAKYW